MLLVALGRGLALAAAALVVLALLSVPIGVLTTAGRNWETVGRPAALSDGVVAARARALALLGQIIEAVTGAPFEEFLDGRIFRPLGMADTGFERHSALLSEGARGYGGVNRPQAPHLPYAPLWLVGAAGGFHSTVEDLYRWDQALYGDRVLHDELRRAMFTAGPGGYGYGWWIGEKHGKHLVRHGGAIDGYNATFERYPDQRVTIIVLSNDDWRARTWPHQTAAQRLGDAIGALALR